MRETIYTIPINIEFEKKSPCALCRLHADAGAKALEYITGAAMMEPDVRMSTNEKGFCAGHFADMLRLNNRLSVALMLLSHLDEVTKNHLTRISGALAPGIGKSARGLAEATRSCFVCERVEMFMRNYAANIVHMWGDSAEFMSLYRGQNGFCLPHAADLLAAGEAKLNKRSAADFARDTLANATQWTAKTRAEVEAFTKSFDYRNIGTPLSDEVKLSVETAIKLLTGE